jgi:hypothetical protein
LALPHKFSKLHFDCFLERRQSEAGVKLNKRTKNTTVDPQISYEMVPSWQFFFFLVDRFKTAQRMAV